MGPDKMSKFVLTLAVVTTLCEAGQFTKEGEKWRNEIHTDSRFKHRPRI